MDTKEVVLKIVDEYTTKIQEIHDELMAMDKEDPEYPLRWLYCEGKIGAFRDAISTALRILESARIESKNGS